MLLWLLLLHLAIHLLTATRHASKTKNTSVRPIDKKYVIRRIETCPDVGYFFKRENEPNSVTPRPCFLCFCQGDNTAVCWKRENKRCDVESFHYHGLGKRDTRIRRSPAGFSDIFFRDAARDVFNKQSPEQCKPFESSFSDGCPPADWCIGCTVCDCDANGRWDCHILSFCPEKKGSKKLKKRKQRIRTPVMVETVEPSDFTTITVLKRSTAKSAGKPKLLPKRIARGPVRTTPHGRIVKKSAPKETTKRPKKKPPLRYRKVASENMTVRPKIINRNVATHKPVDIVKTTKMQKIINSNNATLLIAQQVVKRVMAAVQKMVRNEMRNMTKFIKPSSNPRPAFKKLNKRHVEKGNRKKPHMKKFIIRNKRSAINNEINSTLPDVTENQPLHMTETTVISVSNTTIAPDQQSYATIIPLRVNESEYYKYTVRADQATTYRPIVVNDVYQTETVLNLINTAKVKNLTFEPINDSANEITSFLDNISDDANDLKFKKWSYAKVSQQKHLQALPTKERNFGMITKNKSVKNISSKSKFHSKDIERKLGTKKYNVVKVVSNYKVGQNDNNQNKSTAQAIRNKITNLQNSVATLFKQFHKNNTVINKSKYKRMGVIKYLKRLFNKIFKRNRAGMARMNDYKLIEILCDTFGPCKISVNDKLFLKSKLKDLNVETLRILKTIQIIKGLLRLIDIPGTTDAVNKRTNFPSDILKLNNILRGTYAKMDNIPLCSTQITQMDYIKKNTQHFIQSVSKFATILNEIVAILTKNNVSNTENFHRILRDTDKQKINDDPFQNFRNLLVRYNLVQNDFMKRMYKQLSEFENKMKQRKVSANEYNQLNGSVAIEEFSRNIITNLRKLKQVAQLQISSHRTKRDTGRNGDSIEYVLTVMEYLMKQNYPLNAPPVNDGIDFLIDTIRNAPDIQSMRKKVLLYAPATLSPPLGDLLQMSDISEDSVSATEKSKEDSKFSVDDTKDLIDQIQDDEKENYEKSQFDIKAEYNVTGATFDSQAEDIPNTYTYANVQDTTKSPLKENFITAKVETFYDSDNGKTETCMNNDIKEPDLGENDETEIDDARFEAINNTVVPEVIPPSIENEIDHIAVTTPFTVVSRTKEPISATEVATVRIKDSKVDESIESIEEKTGFDAKSQIDWVEENFGGNPRIVNFTVTNTTVVPRNNNEVYNTTQIPIDNHGSSAIKQADNKKKKKYNPEKVMRRKQMDFLNSLDYGTERSEFDDSESKDSNDDRYPSDTFPTYFV